MNRIERLREEMAGPPTPEYIEQKSKEGWKLAAVEWHRVTDRGESDAGELMEEIPYGLQVSSDCKHLEQNRDEKEALTLMLEMIVEDKALSEVATGLNLQGHHTRQGTEWTQSSVFFMLPRLIEVAPQIFSSEEWRERRLEVASRMEKLLQPT